MTVRITAKYNAKDFEKIKKALLTLHNINVLMIPAIDKEEQTFQFVMECNKLEFANENNTKVSGHLSERND